MSLSALASNYVYAFVLLVHIESVHNWKSFNGRRCLQMESVFWPSITGKRSVYESWGRRRKQKFARQPVR